MKYIIIFLLSLMSAVTADAQHNQVSRPRATHSEVMASHAMVATSQPLATQVAIEVLKKGGNAIDAAIAANAVLGLVEPTGCGIGGDLYALIWDAGTKRLYGINGSGRSPMGLKLEYFKKNNIKAIPPLGPLSVTIPGCVDAWAEMHEKFGRLPVEEILSPAIGYAREGFPVSESVAYYWEESAEKYIPFPNFNETFTIDGKTPVKGERFKNPRLANTYEMLTEEGFRSFYEGTIADQIVAFVNSQGGFLSKADFEGHKSEWVNPISTNYRGYDVWELPPNGQGIAVLEMLNMIEAYDINAMGFGSKDHLHLFVETKKLAFEDRSKYYNDPMFSFVDTEKLTSKAYAKELMQSFNPDKASVNYPSGNIESGNTIYLSIADADGNIVSLVQSNYKGMGSGMVPPNLGFMLQNRAELFGLDSKGFNVYAPGKRPFHTIIPAFVTKNNKPWLSFGLMSGSTQPQGHVQILINMIDFGMGIQEAGDAPRISHEGSVQVTTGKSFDSGWVNLETGFDYGVIRDLMKMGHRIKFDVGGYGGFQAIMWDEKNKVYFGASEFKKDGQAAGY
ncbi:MAG: gamma-glutamyltransferase [Bacteroidales bacterium]|nr:gamma-glutamyltransferase [Bacteroidales bacterium]